MLQKGNVIDRLSLLFHIQVVAFDGPRPQVRNMFAA